MSQMYHLYIYIYVYIYIQAYLPDWWFGTYLLGIIDPTYISFRGVGLNHQSVDSRHTSAFVYALSKTYTVCLVRYNLYHSISLDIYIILYLDI